MYNVTTEKGQQILGQENEPPPPSGQSWIRHCMVARRTTSSASRHRPAVSVPGTHIDYRQLVASK